MLDCLWLHPKNGIRNGLNLNPFQFDYEIKPNTLNNVNWEKKEKKSDGHTYGSKWYLIRVRSLNFDIDYMCPRVCFHISKNFSVDITKPTASMCNLYGNWYSFGLFASKMLEFFLSPRNYSHFLCKNIQQFGVFFHVIKGSRGIHLFIILLFKSTGRMMWILKNIYVQTHTRTFLLLPIARKAICWWIFFIVVVVIDCMSN